MNKVWTVTLREFLTQVKRPGFWWMTFGMPVLMVSIGLIIATIGMIAASAHFGDDDEAIKPIAIVDHATVVDVGELNRAATPEATDLGQLSETLDEFKFHPWLRDKVVATMANRQPDGELVEAYRSYEDRPSAELALIDKEVRLVVVIAPDFRETFAATAVQRNRSEDKVSVGALERHIRDALLAELSEPEKVAYLKRPLRDAQRVYLDQSEPPNPMDEVIDKVSDYLLPIMLLVLMIMTLFTNTDRLIRGLVEEKQNRVIEVLLSSLSAKQLMAGKVFGLGLVGLLQLSIWNMGMVLPLGRLVGIFQVGTLTMVVFLVFFIMGYFLIATFMLAFGSLGNNIQEAGQWSLIWVMLAMCPMFFLPNIIEHPNGLIAQITTYVPFSAPLGVVARLGAGGIQLWEVGLSLLVLTLTLILSIRLGAKLFRLGILMTGKSPNPIELWRAWRHS